MKVLSAVGLVIFWAFALPLFAAAPEPSADGGAPGDAPVVTRAEPEPSSTASRWLELTQGRSWEVERRFSVRGTLMSGYPELVSASFAWHGLAPLELELGAFLNPLARWHEYVPPEPGDEEDGVRQRSERMVRGGLFLRVGVSKMLVDGRGAGRRAWTVDGLMFLEARAMWGLFDFLVGAGVGVDVVRWLRPGFGVSLMGSVGAPFVGSRTGLLGRMYPMGRLAVGITF